METKEEIIQMSKGLFIVCRTSEIAYRTAAEAVQMETTREILKSYANQRKEFAEEWRSEIRFHSGSEFHADPPVDSWKEIRYAIETGDEKEIIYACGRAEEANLRVYEDALSRRIPWDMESVLTHQYYDIKKAFYFINALELFTNQQFVV